MKCNDNDERIAVFTALDILYITYNKSKHFLMSMDLTKLFQAKLILGKLQKWQLIFFSVNFDQRLTNGKSVFLFFVEI